MTTKRDSTAKKPNYQIMGKREYAAARTWMKLNHTAFCEVVGISIRQDQYFRSGHSAVPPTLAKLIRTIIDHGLKPEEVGRVR
jgi:hypothetical protein